MSGWRRHDDMSVAQMLDLPPVWLLAALIVVRLQVWLFPGWSQSFALTRFIGGGLVVAGVALMVWSLARFRASDTTIVPHQKPVRIITDGPFALSRNPIYLGDVLVLLGAIFWWGAWPSLIVIPIFMAIIARRFIAPEEARLKQSFGAEYASFSEKTRRWL